MEALLISTGVIALGEIGDKTQLLALVLATRFKKPIPIILGILVATIINHGFAGALGSMITQSIGYDTLRWILGVSFIGMAIWTLIPDKLDKKNDETAKYGVFVTTLITFFLVEMGDKTQVATIALAAKYNSIVTVVSGTTLGMLIADVPAVIFGDKVTMLVPMKVVHAIAAGIFFILGVLALLNVGGN